VSIKNNLRSVRNRSYLNRDFDSFRADLLRYAKTYFPNNIQDFSEASVGGMFLDLAAYVGDVSAYYLDHQFRELSVDTAVETENIQNLLRMAGVKVVGASPAIVTLDVAMVVPAKVSNGSYSPNATYLPVLIAGSQAVSKSGIIFELDDDVDFSEASNGSLVADYEVASRDAAGNPASYIVSRSVTCLSGKIMSENFSIDSTFVPFRTINLANVNVTEVISVRDAAGNKYYEVDALTQDSVFDSVINVGPDRDLVPYVLELVPAPYRYTASMALGSGVTTLQFGSGNSQSLDNDIIPDPGQVALPVFGRKQVARVAIDPNSILSTSTLGYSPTNTSITVRYRHGGGLDHNVDANTVTEFSRVSLRFPVSGNSAANAKVRASISVNNPDKAAGGEAAPTIDDLKLRIGAARNAQNRIVSVQDLLSRVYTMPSSYGRVYRAGVAPSEIDPSVTNLYICSRNANNQITVTPDTHKRNLRTYLNQFRLISDNIDILDAQIFNYEIRYTVNIEYDQNKRTVMQSINARLKKLLATTNFQIGQPIVLGDLVSVIITTTGVSSVSSLRVVPITGTVSGREYSESSFNVQSLTRGGVVRCPSGGIFELKYPDYDIIGSTQ
jgi:hypothetical protein